MVLSNPNIAFLLLSLGSLGLLIELFDLGAFLPGVASALALIVAFFSLGTLPVNWAGVALVGLGFALLTAELFVPSFGALGIGGVIALALGGLVLTTSNEPSFHVSRWLALGLPAAIGVLMFAFAIFVLSGRRWSAAAWMLVGARGVARSRLDPDGFVLIRGERWRARSPRVVSPT